MIIRSFREADLPSVVALHLDAFKEIGVSALEIESIAKDPQCVHHIVELDGVIVASSIATKKENSIYWNWLSVQNGSRRLGVAQLLTDELKSYAKAQGIKTITGDTRNRFKNALMLYLKNDFEIVGVFQQTDLELMVRVRYPVK